MNQLTDDKRWAVCDPDDLWIYDKLILSTKLGYVCGGPGVPVPKPGKYIVRPVINLLGMGIGSKILHIENNTDDLTPGHFWCEIFTGRHLSIDYINGEQVDAVEGFKSSNGPLWKWNKWERVDIKVPFPTILNTIKDKEFINCEFIDGKLIEVHQRLNQDLNEYNEVIPVWKGDNISLDTQGYTYYDDPDYKRLGFWKR